MKVAILAYSRDLVGGVERLSHQLRDGLLARGCEVTILGKEDIGPASARMLPVLKKVGLDQPFLGWALSHAARKGVFDVVVTNGMFGWALQNSRIINISHGTSAYGAVRTRADDSFVKFFLKRYVWSFFEGKAARNASVCVAVSEETRQSVIKYYGGRNVVHIPNPVDTEVFAPGDKASARAKLGIPADANVLFFASRLGSQKAASLMFDIARRVKGRDNKALMVGAVFGQDLSSDLGILSLGKLLGDDLVDAYRAADAFLLPSRHEGSSLALLEAMSCGTPFLASPVGLVPELQERNLFSECIVEVQDADEYLRAFDALLALPEHEKDRLKGDLRSYAVERHSLPVFSEAYYDLIRSLVS